MKESLGDWSDGGTPGHIPNPEVKTVSADGTWGAAPWESRSLPRDFSCLFKQDLKILVTANPLTVLNGTDKMQPALLKNLNN